MARGLTKKQAAVAAAIAEDTSIQNTLDPDRLAATIEQAREMVRLERQITATQEVLKELNEKYRQLTNETVPALMEEIGQTALPLSDKLQLIVFEGFECSLPTERGIARIKDTEDRVETAARRARALKWLADNKFASLIKTEVAAVFGKGEDAKAKKLQTLAKKELGISLSLERNVHPSTLKSFLKEMLSEGRKNVPLADFGVHTWRAARLEPIGRKKQGGQEVD